jgi:DNA-binding transcriptional LysR family regulator
MAPIDLDRLRAFVRVYDTGSFTTAAACLEVPRSTVSRIIGTLEDQLAVRLFHRTTRSVAPTTAGAALYDRVHAPVRALDLAIADLPEHAEEPSGTLRITSTTDLGSIVLAEAVARYVARYPGVDVDVRLSNEVLDLVRGGIDLALRIRKPRRARDSSMVTRRVGSVTVGIYAAPDYLARRGTPRRDADLADHTWVGFRGEPGLVRRAHGDPPGARPCRVTSDDMFFTREALRRGIGVGMLPDFLAAPEVAAGALVRIVPRWRGAVGEAVLAYPARRNVPRKVTAFADLVAELLRRQPLG